jgi:hypothetical protein
MTETARKKSHRAGNCVERTVVSENEYRLAVCYRVASVRMIVNHARQLCSGIHRVQEEGVGQGTHGDELH